MLTITTDNTKGNFTMQLDDIFTDNEKQTIMQTFCQGFEETFQYKGMRIAKAVLSPSEATATMFDTNGDIVHYTYTTATYADKWGITTPQGDLMSPKQILTRIPLTFGHQIAQCLNRLAQSTATTANASPHDMVMLVCDPEQNSSTRIKLFYQDGINLMLCSSPSGPDLRWYFNGAFAVLKSDHKGI